MESSSAFSLYRCYKANGTFPSGTLPLMHRVAPCQQDGLEMVPLGQATSPCLAADTPMHHGDRGAEAGQTPEEERGGSSPSQHSCCLVGNGERFPMENTGELSQMNKSEEKVKMWR